MKTLFAYCAVVLMTACGPYIDVNHGIVHAGFMSKTQAFAGKMKSPGGGSATWSVVGTDSTDVPMAVANAYGITQSLKWGFKTRDSDNMTTVSKAKINTTPTVTTPTESASGAILTPKVTFPPQQ